MDYETWKELSIEQRLEADAKAASTREEPSFPSAEEWELLEFKQKSIMEFVSAQKI